MAIRIASNEANPPSLSGRRMLDQPTQTQRTDSRPRTRLLITEPTSRLEQSGPSIGKLS